MATSTTISPTPTIQPRSVESIAWPGLKDGWMIFEEHYGFLQMKVLQDINQKLEIVFIR